MQQEPIDAVITWVDGSDPQHAKKLDDYLASIGKSRPRSASKTRFHNAGEIDYCVTSILKFAPWIRTIFIVTDNQQPQIFQKLKGTKFESKIKIIDHKEIYKGYEQVLPTFNSSSILTMLWRIPELSEYFVFFNDDIFLINPVKPENFFENEKPVLRGSWRVMNEYLPHKVMISKIRSILGLRVNTDKVRPSHRERQQLAAKLAGFDKKYLRLPHVPHVWKKSTFANFFAQFPERLISNIEPKFRSASQFVVEALACHLEIKSNTAVFDPVTRNVQLKPGEQSLWRIKDKLKAADKSDRLLFVCLQSVEVASEDKQKLIFSWLDKRIGSVEDLI